MWMLHYQRIFINCILNMCAQSGLGNPICQMLGEDEKETRSYPEGVGLVGFKQSGNFSLNDEIKTWGNEDWEFLFQLYHAGIYPIRNQNGNFLHYYHPPVDKKNYKKIW